ncbi:hypothetical protein AOLI_G00234770 [Acnodon oligacanthus]
MNRNAFAFNTLSYDPCNKYTSLNQPWRGTNETGGWITDSDFNWNGWYRLLYDGMSVRMPESCVDESRCGTDTTLSTPIRVKACPGNYYVYEFVKPNTYAAAYCADVNTITPNSTLAGDAASSINTVVLRVPSYDPCYNYTALDQPWRGTNEIGGFRSDESFDGNGWYRLLYRGRSVRMPESCVNPSRCGTYFTLWLNGSHPQIEDGIVTRGVCGRRESDCCYFRFTPIRVKACPGNYYVYEFVPPSIRHSAYCAG